MATGIVGFKSQGGIGADGFNAGNRTYICNITCPSPTFDGFQLRFANGNSVPANIQVKAAPVATLLNNGVTGSPVWDYVTFGGLTTGVIPAATPPGTGDADQLEHGYLLSDVMGVKSIPRTDAGKTAPVLGIRCFSDQNQSYAPYTTTAAASVLEQGVEVAGVLNSVGSDQVTTIGAQTPVDAGALKIPALEIIWYTGGKVTLVQGFADSLLAGSGTDPASYGAYANKYLRDNGYPMTISNLGISGRRRSGFSRSLRQITPTSRPGIVIFHSWTVNSGGTLTEAQQTAISLADLAACRAIGAKVIVVGMHGNASYSARWKRLMGGNLIYLDMTDLLVAAAGSANYSAFLNPDGTHLNTAGAQVIGVAVGQAIASLIG